MGGGDLPSCGGFGLLYLRSRSHSFCGCYLGRGLRLPHRFGLRGGFPGLFSLGAHPLHLGPGLLQLLLGSGGLRLGCLGLLGCLLGCCCCLRLCLIDRGLGLLLGLGLCFGGASSTS